MKKYLSLTLLCLSFFGNTQIVSVDTPPSEKKTKKKVKTDTELYFGVSPAYTYRTLTINDGLFAQPIGHRVNETAKWTTGFNVGIRNKISEHVKLEIGAGYSSNEEYFDFTENDSVFRYTNTYRNLTFPIRLAYTYGEDISFYTGIGIIPKAFLSMKREETVLDTNRREETTISIEREKFNLFLVDAVITVGTQIKLNPNYGLFAMIEARRQLNNNYNRQSAYIRKPYALGFNVGIEIYL